MTPLISALMEKGLITKEQIDDARDKQIGAKVPIHELLVDMGFIKDEDLIRVSSEVFGMPVTEIDPEKVEEEAIKLLPYDKARRYGVLPLRVEDGKLVVATSDPQDIVALDDIGIIAACPVKPVLTRKKDIAKATEEMYRSSEAVYDLLKNIVSDSKVEVISARAKGKACTDVSGLDVENSPVVQLVNLIFADALRSRASDIHLEPQERSTEVRYRIDGDLKTVMKVPVKMHDNIVARIKILSELDIAEKRKTQDGRAAVSVDGRPFDVRISIIPTFHGETVVMRLLDKESAIKDLESLGFGKDEHGVFMREIRRPQGMVLVTGPTGSGKTSTLYAALNSINDEVKNIITIEDPIEYLIQGVSQIQVDPIKDVTFASGLRSILRQDPNVVLVGEIRDKETAQIAFQAAQTGHLVFSTLHTNNAVSTVTRLKDIGLEPYIISSSVNLIVAQRLVRTICSYCKEEYSPAPEVLARFSEYIKSADIKKFYRGKGCEKCGYSGFRGRTALIEMMPFTERIKALVSEGAREDEICKAAREGGLKTIAEAGVFTVADGKTTFEEVEKVADIAQEVDSLGIQAGVPGPEEISSAAKRERPLVLIADDEADIRLMLKKRLTDAGYDVIQAVNGREEVEMAARENPDIIITDIMMPEMDGVEATKTLRSSLRTAAIPIVMLTARQEKESELEGIEAGADDYITKPFDKDKLLARVKMLIKRRERQ